MYNSQLEDMRISSSSNKCPHCRTSFPTKKILDHHTGICNFIHTSAYEHSIDKYYNHLELPTQESMVHYLFHLTTKYQELEQKFAKLQQSIVTNRRKTIHEYLEQLTPPEQTFLQWATSLEITMSNVETVFHSDLKSGIQQVLETAIEIPIENLPIRAFSQKPNIFYLYDTASEWRLMSSDEFNRFIDKIEHKFLKKYTQWVEEHRQENHTSIKSQDEAMSKMAKISGLRQGPRSPFIKKWLYTRLALSLKQFSV